MKSVLRRCGLVVGVAVIAVSSAVALPMSASAGPATVTPVYECGGGLSLPFLVGSENQYIGITVDSYVRDHTFVSATASDTIRAEEIVATNDFTGTLHNVRGYLPFWGINLSNTWLVTDGYSNTGHYAYVNTSTPGYPGPAGPYTDGGSASYRIEVVPAAADASPIGFAALGSLGGLDDFGANYPVPTDPSWEVPTMSVGDVAAGAQFTTIFYTEISSDQPYGFDLHYSAQIDCPTITSPAPPATGTQGTAYSATVAATGFTAVAYQLGAGSTLPAGLSLDAVTGQISGTPTASGATTFTILAVDTYGNYDSKQYTITIPVPASVAALAATGSNLQNPVIGALGLLALGFGALALRRRRRLG